MRRRKKARLGKISKISIIVITTLNLVGITYAQWNDSLDINSIVSTGEIDPYFTNIVEPPNSPYGNLTVEIVDDKTIKVEGIVTKAYSGVILYQIRNKGTLPIKTDFETVFSYGSRGGEIFARNSKTYITPDSEGRNGTEPDGMIGITANALKKQTYELSGDIIVKQGK